MLSNVNSACRLRRSQVAVQTSALPIKIQLRGERFLNLRTTTARERTSAHTEQEERCGANQPAFIAECSKGMRLPVIRDRLFGFQGPTVIDRSNPSFGPVRA